MKAYQELSKEELLSLKAQLEAELEYPGQIKVNVIRESRVIDYAK